MRLVFFGSGTFGLPTFERLATSRDVAMVVTQPDRPAGRGRRATPTPIATCAGGMDLDILKPEDVNEAEAVARIRGVRPDAYVVIAFGQKLSPALLEGIFAINLHGSLLPRYRGAAPISRAMMSGERVSGLSVIAVANRMDAGAIYAQHEVRISPSETAGELHDRLAALGPDLVERVLHDFAEGRLSATEQDDSLATRAPKLQRSDAFIDFAAEADAVRARIHGLTPWPGCGIQIDDIAFKVIRAEAVDDDFRKRVREDGVAPGTVLPDLTIACGRGRIRLLEVQPPGRRAMPFEAFVRGHRVAAGSCCRSVVPVP